MNISGVQDKCLDKFQVKFLNDSFSLLTLMFAFNSAIVAFPFYEKETCLFYLKYMLLLSGRCQ